MNKDMVDWIFKSLFIGIATYGVAQFGELKDSVINLNTKIAVLITTSKHQSDQIKENKVEIKEIKETIHASK